MDRQHRDKWELPAALKAGDTLAIVAPASPFDRPSFDAGVRALASMDFTLVIPEEIYDQDGYLAGSDQRRADLINRLFADPSIDGIICARGGYGAMRILPLLDVERISCHPKVFVGFSDITVLLVVLVQHCGMVAFHGPTVSCLGDGDRVTQQRLLSALTRPAPLSLAASSARVLYPGEATGRLLCGNLTLFNHLMGTPYMPDFADCVLLLEDQGEAPYRIDRMLTQMMQAGCFDGLAGLALGSFTNCGPTEMIDCIVAERLERLNIPILAGFEVGHGTVNMTLPVGLPVSLESPAGALIFHGPALRQR